MLEENELLLWNDIKYKCWIEGQYNHDEIKLAISIYNNDTITLKKIYTTNIPQLKILEYLMISAVYSRCVDFMSFMYDSFKNLIDNSNDFSYILFSACAHNKNVEIIKFLIKNCKINIGNVYLIQIYFYKYIKVILSK